MLDGASAELLVLFARGRGCHSKGCKKGAGEDAGAPVDIFS